MIVAPPDLVERYRTRAPRYTSYPTAPHFRPLEPTAVTDALARSSGPLSLYVHIPFCAALCLYCGCHVEIHRRRDIGAGYVDQLLAELDLALAALPGGGTLAQLALGGGTPTFLLPADMARLVLGIRARLGFAPDIDASIEIDPRSVDASYLDQLVELGFNRYSFGVQDLDGTVLAAVHREQGADTVAACVEGIRRHGDFDLNLDLMYGLPHQTEQSFATTLAGVVSLRPTRVALFHYAHVPWMKPAQKLLEREGLPGSDVKARLFSAAGEAFSAAGYEPVGMDHFAVPGDALVAAQAAGTLQRNFMGYTTRAGLDQLGIGVSAIGSFGGLYAQDEKDRDVWGGAIAAGSLPVARGFRLSEDDRARRAVIMDLFCNFRARLEPLAYPAEMEALAPLEADGLVVRHVAGIEVTPLGRHFIRNVCAVFDQYLEADAGQRRYSQTA